MSENLGLSTVDPVAAEEVEEGDCDYEDCEADADLRVQFEHKFDGSLSPETALICDDCDKEHCIWVRANDLLEKEVTVDA